MAGPVAGRRHHTPHLRAKTDTGKEAVRVLVELPGCQLYLAEPLLVCKGEDALDKVVADSTVTILREHRNLVEFNEASAIHERMIRPLMNNRYDVADWAASLILGDERLYVRSPQPLPHQRFKGCGIRWLEPTRFVVVVQLLDDDVELRKRCCVRLDGLTHLHRLILTDRRRLCPRE